MSSGPRSPHDSGDKVKDRRVWGRIARQYDYVFRDKSTRQQYARVHELLTQDLAKVDAKVVLDAATGTGEMAIFVATSTPSRQVAACDLSPKMIAVARDKARRSEAGAIDWCTGDVCALPYPDHAFDAVILANVLHIIPEPERAIAEARRVLRPGGVLVAPTFCWDSSRWSLAPSLLLRILGLRVHKRWSVTSYPQFFTDQGLTIIHYEVIDARLTLTYVSCR